MCDKFTSISLGAFPCLILFTKKIFFQVMTADFVKYKVIYLKRSMHQYQITRKQSFHHLNTVRSSTKNVNLIVN